MTSYTPIIKVLYRPCLSNDFTWKLKELARIDADTNKTVVVFSKNLNRKEVRKHRRDKVRRLKKGGFLGQMTNRGKLHKLDAAIRGMKNGRG